MAKNSAQVRERPVVLVVDDFDDARETYRELLQLEGYDVIVASNGEEALSLVQEVGPDVVLMDLSMPVMDGYGATRALKEDARTRHIPVVALTGHVLARHTVRALDAGCDTVLPKPCQPTRVADKIRKMLHTSQARR
jgi:CheY-like chemotaxis protein